MTKNEFLNLKGMQSLNYQGYVLNFIFWDIDTIELKDDSCSLFMVNSENNKDYITFRYWFYSERFVFDVFYDQLSKKEK